MDSGLIVGMAAIIFILTVPPLLVKFKPEWVCNKEYLRELERKKKREK